MASPSGRFHFAFHFACEQNKFEACSAGSIGIFSVEGVLVFHCSANKYWLQCCDKRGAFLTKINSDKMINKVFRIYQCPVFSGVT